MKLNSGCHFYEHRITEACLFQGKLTFCFGNAQQIVFENDAEGLFAKYLKSIEENAFVISVGESGYVWAIPFKSVVGYDREKSFIFCDNGRKIQAAKPIPKEMFDKCDAYYERKKIDLEAMVLAMWDAPGMPGANQLMAEWEEENEK